MAKLDIKDLIDLVESKGRNTAIDARTQDEYEEAKFLEEQEERQNARIAKSAGVDPELIKGRSRREVQALVSQLRTRRYDKEAAASKEKYGTTEKALIKQLEGKGQFRSKEEIGSMAFSDPDTLAAEADEIERLFFPRGRAYSDRANAKDIAAGIDEVRRRASSGPKSADVTAQRAAQRLPDFERLNTTESEAELLRLLSRGEMSAGEAASIRTALKPKAALEEEELIARMRPDAERMAKMFDTYTAADDLLAPLSEASKLSLPEVRARKRLASEIQKRGVDPFNLQKSSDPRALPSRQRTNNPRGVATMTNPTGEAPNALEQADRELAQAFEEPPPDPTFPVVSSTYDLATRSRKRRDEDEMSNMFGPSIL